MQETENVADLISALADGKLRGQEFARAVEWLDQDEGARLTWHAYHVVGDVLRHGDAMSSPRDAVFIQRMKLRLQQEVPIAPSISVAAVSPADVLGSPAEGAARLRQPSANKAIYHWEIALGLASLAAVSVIGWHGLTGGSEQFGAPQLGQAPMSRYQAELALPPPIASAAGEQPVMLRDPQLDALLAAHKQLAGTSAFQLPEGFIRNATFEGGSR